MTVWKRTEVRSLILATVVLILTAVSSAEDWRQSRLDRAADQQSRVVLEWINRLVSSVKDAETGQRGYLLTRDLKYLQPYRDASVEAPAAVERLKHILPPNSDTQQLFGAVSSKMAELSQTIEIRNRASFEAALAIVTTDRGKQDMDTIRAAADRLTKAEYARLAANSERAKERTSRASATYLGGSALLLGLLVLSAATIHRNNGRREQLITLLEEDDRRLREFSLKAQDAESKMRNILESIADGFVSFDRNYTITYVNSAAEQIFGRNKEDLLGKFFWTEFPDEATTDVKSRYSAVMETQTPLSFELFLPKRESWWEESVYWAKDGGLSIYFRDVTERKRLDERGRHTQKLESLGVLAGGIAHDFNNLLTAILGGASLLQEELLPDSAAAKHVEIVVNASERAAQLTRQMLAYSGRGRFVVEQLDISQQVREITQLLESSVTRGVELVMSLEASGILVEADSGQIQQLVMNLVLNGAEAIENGPGTVIISTRVEELDADYVRDNMAGDNIVPGRYILLEVHDTGKGMDPQTLSRIFDPFFTTKFTGRGLGLAAVIGIVRGHHGAIKMYSHPGQGTTFKIFFPVSADQAQAPVVAAQPKILSGSETILIVDDEETVQSMALAALRRYGYQVMQARNGREALDTFERDGAAISLVLLDMTMPVMSGEETLKRLKAMRPDVLVIASSGYNEIEALRRFGQGVHGFLQKPYRAAQLAEKIRSALAMRSSAVS